MAKPTVEEYNNALQQKETLIDWLRREREYQDKLLDSLVNTRNNILMYKKAIEEADLVIQKYKIYEEVENK